MPRRDQGREILLGHERHDVVLHLDHDRRDVALAGDLVHDGGVGRPEVQGVRGAENAVLLLGHGDDLQRLAVEEDDLPYGIPALREELFPRVVVDDHVGGVGLHVVGVEEAPVGGLQALHVEVLLAHAAELRVDRDVAVDERPRAGGVGRGAGDVALFAEDVGIGHGKGFHALRAAISEAAARVDVDGVGAHRADVGDDLFL